MRAHWKTLLMGLAISVAGCTSKEPAPVEPKAAEPAPAPTAAVAEPSDPVAEATEIFQSRCTVCHGATGKGDGEGSAALDPKPRDFSSAEWQASVTDEHIQKIIVGGGLAVGKAATMPANPDLDGKPEVVAELAKIVRSLAK
ncbi:MAG: c-type cytochrome [Myxococcales bacterium]|nr:c-type cytochrome [Myxococcales bacterium]